MLLKKSLAETKYQRSRRSYLLAAPNLGGLRTGFPPRFFSHAVDTHGLFGITGGREPSQVTQF